MDPGAQAWTEMEVPPTSGGFPLQSGPRRFTKGWTVPGGFLCPETGQG